MRPVALEFTGSGEALRRELRRDRLVNLLLGGVYTPVVARKQSRYLAAHTRVAGEPVAWVEVRQPRWPAVLLVAVFLAVRLAQEFGHGPPMPVVIAAGVLMLPYLWASSVRRRIGALRWRHRPLRFTASWRAVYAASWPVLLVGLAWAAMQPTVTQVVTTTPDARWIAPLVTASLAVGALLVRQGYQWRRLRTNATWVGDHALHSDPGFARHLRTWLATAGAVLLTAVLPVLLLRVALGVPLTPADPEEPATLLVPLVAAALVYLLATPARAWHEGRMVRLWWDGAVVNGLAQVACRLDVRGYVQLRTRETLRALLTLGRSRSEGAVRAWRMLLGSVALEVDEVASDAAQPANTRASNAPSA